MRGESARKIDLLISKSYDADPRVRLDVVRELSGMGENPGAVFALIELASDKDEKVKSSAQEALSRVKSKEDFLSLEKLFVQTQEQKVETETDVREKLLPSIDRLFTNKRTKKQLMSSLGKFFSEKKKHQGVHAPSVPEPGQTVLKEHVEIAIPKIASGEEKKGGKTEPKTHVDVIREVESIAGYHEEEKEKAEAGEIKAENLSQKPETLNPKLETEEFEQEEEGKDETLFSNPKDLEMSDRRSATNSKLETSMPDGGIYGEAFSRAYMLASRPEVSDKILSEEEKRMQEQALEAVKTAFRAARLKARGMQVGRLASLQKGMRKVKTGEVTVGEAQTVEILKGKRRTKAVRIVLLDSTGKFPLYLSEARGNGISVGDRLILEGGKVEEIGEGTEVALSVSPRGKVIVLK